MCYSHGKRDFAELVEVMNCESTLDYPHGPNLSTCLLKCRRGKQKSQRDTTEEKRGNIASTKGIQPNVAALMMEEGGPKSRNAGDLQKLGMALS